MTRPPAIPVTLIFPANERSMPPPMITNTSPNAKRRVVLAVNAMASHAAWLTKLDDARENATTRRTSTDADHRLGFRIRLAATRRARGIPSDGGRAFPVRGPCGEVSLGNRSAV